MKKILAILGCMALVWLGLLVALLAFVEEVPGKQFVLTLASAILFCGGILCAGYGNSLQWKEKK